MGGRLYLAAVGSILTLVGVVLAASGTQGPPVYVSSGGAPSGACSGERVWMTKANPSDTWCCISSAWVRCGVGTANPIPNCAPGEFVTADGGGFICKSLSLVETDPKSIHVGAMPLCANGYVLKNTDAGFSCVNGIDLSDYSNTADHLAQSGSCPSGSAIVGLNTYMEPTECIVPISKQCPGGNTLHSVDDAGTWGCVQDVPPAYGELHEDHDLSAATIVMTNKAPVYYPWVSGHVGDCYNMTCVPGTNGDAGPTGSVGYLQIVQAGEYRIHVNAAYTQTGTNDTIETEIWIQHPTSAYDAGPLGQEYERCGTSNVVPNNGEGEVAFGCLVNLVAGDKVRVAFTNESTAGKSLTFTHIAMSVSNIAPTVAVGTFSGNYVASVATASPLAGGQASGQSVPISLSLKDCGQGKILKSFDGGWSCVTENDPTVNDLAKEASISAYGCDPTAVPYNNGSSWECRILAEVESDPSVNALGKSSGPNACGQGQVPIQGDGGWGCTPVVTAEVDPKVLSVTNGKWCVGTGTQVACATNSPIPATCSAGQATTSNGTALSCTSTITASDLNCTTCVQDGEIDSVAVGKIAHGCLDSEYLGPVAGTIGCKTIPITTPLTSGRWCSYSGTSSAITCSQLGVPQSCNAGEVAMWTGSSWACGILSPFKVASDVTQTTTSWTDITGLTISVFTNNMLAVDCSIRYSVGAVDNGIAMGLNGPASSVTSYETTVTHSGSIDVVAHGTRDFCDSNSLASGSAGCAATASTTAANTVYNASLRGYIKAGSDGTVAFRIRGGNADSAWTIKALSWCKFTFMP